MELAKENEPDRYGMRNVQLQFDEDNIYLSLQKGETTGDSKYTYSVIRKVGEGICGIYLYYDAAQAYIIPVSAFESTEQKKGFLDFIEARKLNVNDKYTEYPDP
jgi:hypothetical protein